MLEKDKNCIEFSMHSMMATHKPYQEDTEIAITGMAPGKSLLLANNPFDIPCDVVVVSKRYFERLQTENEKLKKKLEEFSPVPGYREFLKALYPEATETTIEKLVWTTGQLCCGRDLPNALQTDLEYYRALSSSQAKSVYNWKEATGCSTPEEAKELIDCKKRRIIELKDELEECEKDYISARDKVEALDKEIGVYSRALKDWKEGTGCPSPSAAKTLIENGPTHIIYLNDPLGVIAKWEKVTGYDRPEDFLKWKANIEGIMEAWKDRTGCKYPGEAGELLEKWKLMTKCETPEAAATWITSYESACGRGNRLAESVEKLKEEVVSWKNVTGYSTPEDYMHARISGAFHTPFDYTAAWQKATGCDAPEAAIKRINGLINEAEAWESDYNHLLALTGFGSEGEIEDALDQCDHSTLRKALVDYEFDYEELLKLTGYKSNQDIRVALNYSEQFVYETMRELINSLKRKAKFTESGWKEATGCDSPEAAETTLRNLRGRIDEIKTFAAIASNWTDRIVED